MAVIAKLSTGWSGTTGGPGLTQVYVEEISGAALSSGQVQAAVNAMRTFWDSCKGLIPDEIVLTVQPVVDMYTETTGVLTGTATAATAPTSVTGTATAAYSMAAGIKVNLQTNNIRNGRRVRGSIFIVPAASSAMTSAGVIASATRTTINTAGATMIASLATNNMNLIVWGRPIPTGEPNGPRNGTVNFVVGVDTSEKSAILRGRRD